ncbi:hypothetical protein BDV23DRAFT_186789 [Aspergillus alliaceus]|uniref:Uncharacterized protein n=1 Tax=Petromyces alliaceus TaxID=209559 RepID=A0A5N7BZ37_PETAA|nr:hypothetical protein BDV23DRAFT_186789 [Aspergillus alliaceus]
MSVFIMQVVTTIVPTETITQADTVLVARYYFKQSLSAIIIKKSLKAAVRALNTAVHPAHVVSGAACRGGNGPGSGLPASSTLSPASPCSLY